MLELGLEKNAAKIKDIECNPICIDGQVNISKKIFKDLGSKLKYGESKKIIQHLYEVYPDNWETYIKGNFSISIFNEKQNQINLISDHFGSKPLYYCQTDNFFAFSSEIKLLKCIPKLNLTPNKKKILQY